MKSPFLNAIAENMRMRRYAKRTIESYIHWIITFINYNQNKHPSLCHDAEVEQFLSYLANKKTVAPKTQALALNSLVFLYKEFLDNPLTLNLKYNRTSAQPKLPVVLTQEETGLLLKNIPASCALPVKLLYASGLRLMESVRLRIQDIDFDYLSVQIWHGKGGKHRRVTLAEELVAPLKKQMALVQLYFDQDLKNEKYSGVYLPYAWAGKYPKAPKEFNWHYLFPSNRVSVDPDTGLYRRHHVHESNLQRAVRNTAKEIKLSKKVTCHTKGNLVKCYLLSNSAF